MNKRTLEAIHDVLYAKMRSYLAKKTRIRIFKKKCSRKSLFRQQIKEIKTFYKPYIIPNMTFHKFYVEKTGDFYPEYIPQDIYVGHIDPYFNDLRSAKFIDNKCYYDFWFHKFPQPYLVLKRMNNIWLNHFGKPVDAEEMKKLIANENEGLFIKQAEDSLGGFGVTFIENTADAYDKIINIANTIKFDIVIQRKLTQHPDCAKLNNSSVNSVRIYSLLRKDGSVKIYSSVLRMGVGNTKVDNYGSGGISCGITPDGTLKKYAYNKVGARVDKHPYTGVVFEGYKIPSYDKAVELVKEAHLAIPHFRSVSWDVAINEEGSPVLIEANLSRGSIDLLQLSNGPLFGDDTVSILNEVFGNN